MNFREELRSAGTDPTGPVSAWPHERHERLMAKLNKKTETKKGQGQKPSSGVNVPVGKMAKGLLKTAGQAVRYGKVTTEIREERYDMCKACPFFDEESKRCKDCGCFMEAKTWVGGDPKKLCPQKKWSR